MKKYKTVFCKSLILFWGLVGSTPQAIDQSCERLEKQGYEVVHLDISLDGVSINIRSHTAFSSGLDHSKEKIECKAV